VFTVEQRDALRQHVIRLGEEDERVVAGALVGSLAGGTGDRFSDIDLTFGVADGIPILDVLDDWTRALTNDLAAVHLVDLERDPAVYRVFLFPDALQLDLSMRPSSEFRPGGPRFALLFGETAPDSSVPPETGTLFISTPATAEEMFGWGVIYALHARACIERGRVWQAEHYVGTVRDLALSLACLREGVTVAQARGYDDLSPEARASLDGAHIGSVAPDALRHALAASVRALMQEGAAARLPHAETVSQRLAELR